MVKYQKLGTKIRKSFRYEFMSNISTEKTKKRDRVVMA